MVKYIVGGVIVVLSWALAIIIPFPLWIPAMITLLVALVIVLLVGIDKLRERRAARALEKALQAQAAAQAASARPDLQHEIAEMQAEFEKAVTALKGSKKGGKKALYTLPWYTIIGPPGCGKSTALRNSGLQFPYLSASGGGVRGLGGTRNCDWWMTSDAVILDTAGRWTTEDEDHDEWLGFLDLIKRFRPRKPLNGILAAVSIGEIGGAREDEVVELARRVRERIDEVQDHLQMSLPVYVVFTKCDLIPGFIESFDNLSKQDRGQVWGFTAPLTQKIASPRDHFTERFDEMMRAVEKRALRRMGEERKIANRELMYGFPQQLEVMRANLAEFVHQLFLENVFKDTPLMRGVYMTSGTQEGRPIDRVMSRMAEAFGQPQVQLPEPRVESKSYFLRDVFSEIVFKDAEVAVRSPDELKRQRTRTILAAAIIFLFALGISGLPAVSWALNRSLIGDTEERIDTALRAVAEDADEALIGPTDLEPLRVRTSELEENDAYGPPLYMQMGMYPDDIYEPVRDTYLQAMNEHVIGRIVTGDAEWLDAFARRVEAQRLIPPASEMRLAYDRLKRHILLTRPRGEHEPALDDDLREFLRQGLTRRWTEAAQVERHGSEHAMIEDNVAHFVEALGDHPSLYHARNEEMVTRVRVIFARVGGNEMAVQGIVEEVDRRGIPDLTLQQMTGRVQFLGAREVVPGAFTRRGWEEHVERMLEQDAARFFGEHWVLGTEPPANAAMREIEQRNQIAALRSYFFERYVEAWEAFIGSLYVVVATDDQNHLLQLTEFTSGEPQLLTALIRSIDYNLTLVDPNGGGADTSEARARAEELAERRAAGRLGRLGGIGSQNARRLLDYGSNQVGGQLQNIAQVGALPPDVMTAFAVRVQFRGFLEFAPPEERDTPTGQTAQVTPARRYEEQLEFLRDALNFKIDGTNVTNFDERQARARELTNALIEERPSDWRPRFRTLLMPQIEGVRYVPPPTPTVADPTELDAPAPTPTDAPTPTPTPTPTPQPTEAAPQPTEAPAEAPAERPRRRHWWE